MEKESKTLNRLAKAGWGVVVFAATFVLGFFSSSHFMPVSESQAEEAGPIYVNVGTSGKTSLEIDAGVGGTAKVGKDTLSVDTNANEYRLYISTAKDAVGNGLYLEGDNTKYISPSTGKIANPTKLAVNTWGYAPSRSTSEDTPTAYVDRDADSRYGKQAFIGVPEHGEEKLLYVNSDPTVAGSNSLDVYYGANTSVALPAGKYSNAVAYTAIADTATPTSSNLTIAPNSQEGAAGGQRVTITTGFYPGDFGLAELGDVGAYIGNRECTDLTSSLTANGNLVLTCSAPEGYGTLDVRVVLYKFDKKYILEKGYSYVPPKPFSDFDCSSLNIGDTVLLNDTRDEYSSYGTFSYYKVTKLKDGRCWFADNVFVKRGASDVKNYKERGTDKVTGNTYSFKDYTTSNWCSSATADCHDRTTVFKFGDARGALYNWYGATAGSGTYARTSGDAGESICPVGWRLPTKTDFETLYNAYGSASALLASSANLTLNGQRIDGANSEAGEAGYFWSATTAGTGQAYALKLTSSIAEISGFDTSHGFSMRCVNLVDTMQDFTPPEDALIGDTKAVIDTRDKEIYHVGKLKDGNWWMIDDLELGDSAKELTLTSTDTNTGKNFILPKASTESSGAWCAEANVDCAKQAKVFAGTRGLNNNTRPGGYYYNFYAATAGGWISGTTPNQTNIDSDICPKGWRLPVVTNNNEFKRLIESYGSYVDGIDEINVDILNTLTAYPAPRWNNTGMIGWDGKIWGGDSDNAKSYWSSSYNWGTIAHIANMSIDSKRIEVEDSNDNAYNGHVIRCIRKGA